MHQATRRPQLEPACVLSRERAPLTPEGRGPLDAPGRHAQTHF
jgi:hypothetical protein